MLLCCRRRCQLLAKTKYWTTIFLRMSFSRWRTVLKMMFIQPVKNRNQTFLDPLAFSIAKDPTLVIFFCTKQQLGKQFSASFQVIVQRNLVCCFPQGNFCILYSFRWELLRKTWWWMLLLIFFNIIYVIC